MPAQTAILPPVENPAPQRPDLLESDEIKDHVQRLDERAWELNGTITQSDSAIYNAWVRYARAHPERIFGLS